MSSVAPNNAIKDEETTALVPKLRFPEFTNTGEWEVSSIGDLKPFVTSGSRGWAPFYAEKGELFIRITNLWRDSIYLDLTDSKFVQLPSGASEGVRTQLKERDVLISITADIGIIGYVDESVPSPAYINQHIALVRFDKQQLCSKYVAYSLASEKSQRLFRASTDTGTKSGMSLIGIQKIKLTLPGLPEQQHIAEFLTSVDKLIATQARKVDVLKTHKKGLLQQLFPREGEIVPARRFTEFKAAGDWMVLPLAALADRIMVGIASAATHAYRETGVPMLRNQNIKEGKIDDSNLLFIDPGYEAAHKGKRLRAGDVITVRTGYPGVSAVVPERYENAQCFTSLITRPKHKILDPAYLCAFINSDIGKRFILGAEAGGAQKNVNAGALEMLPVCLPGLGEQRRISACLSSLDALITAETQKLEAYMTHKKGLMQRLFPVPGVNEP